MEISIDGRPVGTGYAPFVIAELSANHNGSLQRALDTIDAAAECGVDAIKLQTYTADTMTIDCDKDDFLIRGGPWNGFQLYQLYKWAETPFDWHKAMFAHAKGRGLTVFSTPFDETAVDLLESLNAPAYKIASFELLDLALIRYVAGTGKPMIMSTGMATEEEIEEAVDAAVSAGCGGVVLLHCVSSYPAPIEQANLQRIRSLSTRFRTITGLSDHTLGKTASVAAVAIGASVIEKHFTLSRTEKGPDSEFSLEPSEMRDLCYSAKEAWLALGDGDLQRQQCEEPTRQFRRSLYFVRDLPAGHHIEDGDIRRIRPGFGLPPKMLADLLGKTLTKPVERGTPVSFEFFT